jgi:inner membrane protein
MPSPIAHSLVSLTLADRKPDKVSGFRWAAFWIVLGNFPDLDFIPGILIGDPSRYHHGPSHSILFVLLLAILAYYFYPFIFKRNRVALWTIFAVAFSHLFLDTLTVDTGAPYGLPLLWPFTNTHDRFPFSLFLNINRGMSLHVLLTWHNLFAVILELLITLPFLLIVWHKRYGKKPWETLFPTFFSRHHTRQAPR